MGRAIAADQFRHHLLQWFDRHKRDLPWRKDRDPYRIWLSEIMLQQTRVAAALEHYQRFLQCFPTIEKLAAARESSVLAAWSGLGYYRRARLLHAAAKQIVRQGLRQFPTTAEELRKLPGIGRYTSAAIASIAFEEPIAAVDGNVERVLQRLVGKNIGGERLWKIAQELLSRRRPGDFNQAMMELGAIVCTPRQPKCLMCPVHAMCAARGELRSSRQPVRQKKREVNYALNWRNGSVFLVKRDEAASLMPGMWELPEIHSSNAAGRSFLTLRHSITLTDYTVRVQQCPASPGVKGRWLAKSKLARLPLTGLARKILQAAKVI
jgi:A/G-specific adenine glycosylase